MLYKTLAFVAALVLAGQADAETFEVHLKNKGDQGVMVFEPAFIMAKPGDTISFLADDKGHNVETIKGMWPEGVDAVKSEMSKPFTMTVTVEGLYGIKCTPHYAMGMVALIQVGAATNYDAALAVEQKGKAKARFEPLFAEVQR